MTAAAIRRKLASIGKRVPVAGVPCVLEVANDETQKAALTRFAARHPTQERGHRALLVVPAPVNGTDELEAFKEAFKTNQVALVQEAHGNRKPLATTDSVLSPNPIPSGMKIAPTRFRMQRAWSKNNAVS